MIAALTTTMKANQLLRPIARFGQHSGVGGNVPELTNVRALVEEDLRSDETILDNRVIQTAGVAKTHFTRRNLRSNGAAVRVRYGIQRVGCHRCLQLKQLRKRRERWRPI